MVVGDDAVAAFANGANAAKRFGACNHLKASALQQATPKLQLSRVIVNQNDTKTARWIGYVHDHTDFLEDEKSQGQ